MPKSIDEQKSQLLPTNRERFEINIRMKNDLFLYENESYIINICFSNIPLQEVNVTSRESTAVVPGDQERVSDDKRRVSLSDLNKKDDAIYTPTDEAVSSSVEHISHAADTPERPVVISRKDSLYQGSLHNIPLYNEDTDEYHRQMITTSEKANGEIEKVPKKSFFAQIAQQIDLKLLKDAAFALFAVSNFLTSLGFNVPYNFANDLASDAKVIERRRHWIIMTIGIANCLGRVIIGYLADRKWVIEKMK